MHTIKIDVSDNIYDNVMFCLNSLPKKERQEKLTEFFHASPLQDIVLEKDKESYKDRINL